MSPERARIPNYKRLLVSGAMIGLIVGAVISLFGEPVSGYSAGTAALYLGAMGAVVGLALAGLLGVLLDRSGRDGS